ncbi:hypothetical protein DM860_012207 [Cuscuta australis]|uniref:BZIP domain-containing protein n=1 Tax=Cuscuta australis TaxID=267555 RepID=A0A328E6P9_9ASTE|nr:hypothetical protein DM860_012207 [Cuscuta australis]
MNFRSFGNEQVGGGGGRQPGSFGLVRQSSVYSLTFDEFQSTMAGGGIGKDFGSMNMDELLKNIWSAEENQTVGSSAVGSGLQPNGGPVGHLQRQGSLTLPRTLSQKTVDEVWRDILREYAVEKDGSVVGSGSGSNVPQRQQTLGEMTLEEFLSRAGAVREESQMSGQQICNNSGVFGDTMPQSVNDAGLGFAFPQGEIGMQSANLLLNMNGGGASRPSQQHIHDIGTHSANLALNMNGGANSYRPPQPHTSQLQQQQQQQQQKLEEQQRQEQQSAKQQQLLFPKQPPFGYGGPMPIPTNGQLHGSNGLRGAQVMGIPDVVVGSLNGNLIQGSGQQQGGGGMGMACLGAGGSPPGSSDGLTRSNGDTSSVSPIPYAALNESLRGRKSTALEKVVERRQRRMIKNRESAARSRARKQAYTTDLEQEVAKLKEENKELRKKQAEFLEVQKSQALEIMKLQSGAKRQRLRRTQTGPW